MQVEMFEDGVSVGVFTMAEMRDANEGNDDVADALSALESGAASVSMNLGAGGITTLSVVS
jgi:hypothetical protein